MIATPIPPPVEILISNALLFYANHCGGLSEETQNLAFEWHHALQNDTWLLQTTDLS